MAVVVGEVGRRFGKVSPVGWVAGSSLAVVCGLECPATPVVEVNRGSGEWNGSVAAGVLTGGRLLASRLVRAGVPGCARKDVGR